MKYYLETNSLRQLSNKLGDKNFCSKCYTSILSISELLSGIDCDKDFFLRKSILQKINASGIDICPDYPEIRQYNAFGIDLSFSEYENIIRISNVLVKSDNYIVFQDKLSELALAYCWEFLKKYDHNGNIELKKAFRQKVFDSPCDTKKSISEFNEIWDNFNISSKEQFIDKVVNYYARQILKFYPHKSLRELLDSYNHNLDLFFLATHLYSADKISHKNETGKNDYFDLGHLSYLSNVNQIIVTDDKLIHGVMNKLLYKNSICHVIDIK